MKILAYLDFGSESNSGKRRKFIEFEYIVPPYGVGNALGQHTMMINDPRVAKHVADGYNQSPRVIAVFEDNLRDELFKCQAKVDQGGWIDSETRKLDIQLKELTQAKKLYDAGVVEQ